MGRSRNLAIVMGAAGLAFALLVALLFRPDAAVATAQAGGGGTLVGVATCGGTTCHGRSEADGKIVRQDELMIWQDEANPSGAHSRAWRVLAEPRSRAIAQRLGIGEATSAPMCLGCHATPASAPRGARFQTSDGVGCEACHGAASGWLSSHYAVGASHAANVSRGMVPLDNPKARAAVCLDCHFGSADPGQFVNHRIMAAGHPRIAFELDLFSTLQQHHNEDRDYASRKGRTNSVQTWTVGQAMALDRSLTLFADARRGTEGMYPEFYFLDCHSCHRPISDDPRFEPTTLDNPGRPIPEGMPPYNDENMIMLSAAARIAAPGLADRFDRDSRAFHQAMTKDRASAVAAAAALRDHARALANAFAGATMGRAQTQAIIDAIAGEATSRRFTDYAGSVQAVMATDTLLSALVNMGEVSPSAAESIRGDINEAYRAVRDPNAYRPEAFRASLTQVAQAARSLR